jgi:hypothetical protein
MSDYLIGDLERYGVATRDRSEIAELLDGEAIQDRERAARGGAPGGTGMGNDEH